MIQCVVFFFVVKRFSGLKPRFHDTSESGFAQIWDFLAHGNATFGDRDRIAQSRFKKKITTANPNEIPLSSHMEAYGNIFLRFRR